MKLLVLILTVCTFAAAETPLEHARAAQDRAALEKLTGEARAAAQKAPRDANAQYRYALACSYEAEVALEMKDKRGAQQAAEAGVEAAQNAIAIDPGRAEYHRILATLCGQVIPANVLAAFSYGRKAKDAIEKAKQLDPKSSRVWTADGVGNYYLPPSFGGGMDLAISSFQKAVTLDPKDSEAWLWLGLAERKKGQNLEARKAFEKSIAIDPQRVWAHQQLDKTPAQ